MRSEQVRQAILDTAYEMGLREGFEAVTVRKIIHKMGYSTGVVYHHFQDKQEIIDAIEQSETDRLRAAISEQLDDTKDIIHNMEAALKRIMRLAYEEPEKYNLIVLHKYSRNKSENSGWLTYLSENLGAAMRAGSIRAMDAGKAAFAIWSSFLGFHLAISRRTDLTWEQAEELFKVQFDIILRGILA
jgi:AcrR family transcriptional regulator